MKKHPAKPGFLRLRGTGALLCGFPCFSAGVETGAAAAERERAASVFPHPVQKIESGRFFKPQAGQCTSAGGGGCAGAGSGSISWPQAAQNRESGRLALPHAEQEIAEVSGSIDWTAGRGSLVPQAEQYRDSGGFETEQLLQIKPG